MITEDIAKAAKRQKAKSSKTTMEHGIESIDCESVTAVSLYIASYELKPGMFAKATQVDLDPLTSLHSVEKLLTCTSKNGVTGALAHTATPRGNSAD
jgi:hypothetical protein